MLILRGIKMLLFVGSSNFIVLVTIAGKVGPKPTSNLIQRAAAILFGWKLFKFPWDLDPWENSILSRPKLEGHSQSTKAPPLQKQSCIHTFTSVIFLVDWNHPSMIFILAWTSFFLLIGIIHQWFLLAHIPCLRKQPKLPLNPAINSKEIPQTETVGSETSETYLPKGPLWVRS